MMAQQQDNPQTTKTHTFAGLRCPQCDYDLTGLSKRRCPECGTAFDPKALRWLQKGRSKSVALLNYARFIRNCALANLFVQVLVGILNANWGALLRQDSMAVIEGIAVSLGLLGGAIGAILAIGIIVHAGILACFQASWIGMATFIISIISACLAIFRF